MHGVSWREAADLGVDPVSGPDAGQAVWVVELDSRSAVGAVVVLDGETGGPLLVLERQPAP